MNLEDLNDVVNGYVEAFTAALPGLASPEMAALFACAGLGVVLAGLYYCLGPSVVQKRLRNFVIQEQQATPTTSADTRSGSSAIVDVVEQRLARRRTVASLRVQLARAGLSITATEFLGMRVGAALVAGLATGVVLAFRIGWPALGAGVVAAVAGSFVPNVVVSVIINRRMAALERQIPIAIDIVASSLQAGTGLSQGFALLAREMSPPIAEEFAKVLQEVALGLSMTEALMNLANRVNSEELDLVITSIIIQMRVGGNLVHLLRTTAATLRDRAVLKGEIRTLTAQQRLSAVVIGILPPGVAGILWLLSSNYMGGLFAEGITRYMLFGAVAMQLMGMYMLNRISQIDV